MEVKSISKYIRISPRKTRLVADLVRGKGAVRSLGILHAVNKKAAKEIIKTLSSAISNAKNREMKEDSLWIKKIVVDGGPMYKRYMPRAMGRATMIRHTTSHITVLLSDQKASGKVEKEINKEVKKEIKKEKK
jgi:large subunit ribosomal protein L22